MYNHHHPYKRRNFKTRKKSGTPSSSLMTPVVSNATTSSSTSSPYSHHNPPSNNNIMLLNDGNELELETREPSSTDDEQPPPPFLHPLRVETTGETSTEEEEKQKKVQVLVHQEGRRQQHQDRQKRDGGDDGGGATKGDEAQAEQAATDALQLPTTSEPATLSSPCCGIAVTTPTTLLQQLKWRQQQKPQQTRSSGLESSMFIVRQQQQQQQHPQQLPHDVLSHDTTVISDVTASTHTGGDAHVVERNRNSTTEEATSGVEDEDGDNNVRKGRDEGGGGGEEEDDDAEGNGSKRTNATKSSSLMASLPTETEQQQQSTSWWIGLLSQLEQQHKTETTELKRHLQKQHDKKTKYKSELRNNLNTQLQWLEDRLLEPSHVLPGIIMNNDNDNNSVDNDDNEQDYKRSPYHHPRHHPDRKQHYATTNNNNNTTHMFDASSHLIDIQNVHSNTNGSTTSDGGAVGVEVTIDSAAQIQKLQTVENLYEQLCYDYHTMEQQHEFDREEWVRTLEAAAIHDETLTQKQKMDMQHLRHELSVANQKQKSQWKEKTRVLSELLELTERQHECEILEWKEERETLENTIAQLVADKNDILQQYDKARNHEKQAEKAADEWKEQLETMEEQMVDLTREVQHGKETMDEKHEQAVQAFVDEKMEIEQLHEGTLQAMEMEKQQLLIQIDELRKDTIFEKRINEQLHTELQTTQEQLEKHTNELKLFKDQWEEQNDRNSTLQAELEQTQEELSNFRAQAADFTEQAATAKKQCRNLQKNLANCESGSTPTNNFFKPSSSSPATGARSSSSSSSEELDRAMAERDLYQQEAQSLREALYKAQAHAATIVKSTTDENDKESILSKYKESVERHSELVKRLKRIEDQRSQDRGAWKIQLETTIQENKQLHDQKQHLEQAMRQVAESHAEEMRLVELEHEQKYQALQEQSQAKLGGVIQTHSLEIRQYQDTMDEKEQEWSKKLNELKKKMDDKCQELMDERELEILELKEQFHNKQQRHDENDSDSSSNSKNLVQKVEELTNSLNEWKTPDTADNVVDRLERHQSEVLNAIDELRNEIEVVRVHQTTPNTHFDNMRKDLVQIQETLNDAVAEITLETDAMLESRDAIKSVASDASSSNESKKWQERMLVELSNLREQIPKSPPPPPIAGTDSSSLLSRELIADLQNKEAALATSEAELRHCEEKLNAEIAARKMSDSEFAALKDQADVYADEISTLQATNAKLVRKLHEAGLQIDTFWLEQRMSSSQDDDASTASATPRPSTTPRLGTTPRNNTFDDSTPVLDEALALAEGITNIVHGGDDDNHTTSVMEMLESMSDMIDNNNNSSRSYSAAASPKKTDRRRGELFDVNAGASGANKVAHTLSSSSSADEQLQDSTGTSPFPVVVPNKSAEYHSSKLEDVVEQLYGRCQLLDRERLQLMATAVHLLETARHADAGELELALEKARCQSAKELVKLRRENQQHQELFRELLCTASMTSTDSSSSSQRLRSCRSSI